MQVFKVPAHKAPSGPKRDKFRFVVGGKTHEMPSASSLISTPDLIDLMMLDPEPQTAALMKVFASHLPEAAKKAFKGVDQFQATMQAWYADGNGATPGESAASAD